MVKPPGGAGPTVTRQRGDPAWRRARAARASIGDGSDAYHDSHMSWWGGDGATSDRYEALAAGTAWTDSYQMEVRAPGEQFPVTF